MWRERERERERERDCFSESLNRLTEHSEPTKCLPRNRVMIELSIRYS